MQDLRQDWRSGVERGGKGRECCCMKERGGAIGADEFEPCLRKTAWALGLKT